MKLAKKIIAAVIAVAMFASCLLIDNALVFAQMQEAFWSSYDSVANMLADTDDSCDHNYEVTSYTAAATCIRSGNITYTCSKCGSKYQAYTALGHLYQMTGTVYRGFTYKCAYCSLEVSKGVETAMNYFKSNLNKATQRKNDNCFADVVCDGIINAKDYAYMKKMYEYKLINPNANETTNEIYQYLCNTYTHNTISAQQESTWMGSPDYEINHIKSCTGKKPAMRGLDYMNDDFYGVNQRAIQWWNNGGLVTICWHTGSDFSGEWNDAMNDEVADWNKMLTPGTEEYKQMIAGMDKAAKALSELQDAGVTVLWRPFHEFDGGWFWWGKNGAESFVQLWKIMYDRYTNHWGLNNLIWVLGFSHNGIDIANWNPGENYYDIIGADSYDKAEFNSLYTKVKAIAANGKPIALHECGANPTADELKTKPWCYFMTWHTEYLTDTNTSTELSKLYNSDRVITLDELPKRK